MREGFEAFLWGAVTLVYGLFLSPFVVAALARLIWHFRLVMRSERKAWGIELAYEAPTVIVAVFLGQLIAELLAAFLGMEPLSQNAVNGLVALAAYGGAHGMDKLLDWSFWKRKRE